MDAWVIGLVASAIISLAYLTISGIIARGLTLHGMWRSNPLAVATCVIFFSCGIGHGIHAIHLAGPLVGLSAMTAAHTRMMFSESYVWAWELVTAAAATWYLTLRRRLPAVLRSTALYEDVSARRRHALEIHDNIIQEIATAKLATEMGRTDEAVDHLDRALCAARSVVNEFLAEPAQIVPSDLGRSSAPLASQER
jgi:hypothetical protein